MSTQLYIQGRANWYYPGYEEAYCVSQEDFVRIAQTKVGSSATVGASQVCLPSTGVGSSQYAFKATLTSSDVSQAVDAASPQIKARKSLHVHEHILWQTLPGGSSQCTNCGRAILDPVPDETQSIALEVIMGAGVRTGKLFLGSWIPGKP